MPTPHVSSLPTGTLTFLFTDIEGSTQLVSALGDEFGAVLVAHSEIIRAAIANHTGTEVSTEGDAFFAVFPTALRAVLAAADIQRGLAAHRWPAGRTVRVRIGLHTGEGRLGGDNYVGIDVHRAARIAAAGHGGQVLLSDATRTLVGLALPDGMAVTDLAEHRLKDMPAPERIWQLDIEGLPSQFPAIRSLEARRGNLEPSPTPLIGRQAEVVQVAMLVGRRRLVTLIGPGGAGKTRLARAVAERLVLDFHDGAFFIALEDARDRAAVAAAVAAAFGVRERPDRDLERGIQDHLRERELLLVLDNLEQVIGAAPLVAELLAGSPRLRIVATSRAVLHLAAEQTYEVPPLTVPDPHELPPLSLLGEYEAVALFVDRAQAVKADFEITDENARAVAAICSLLDGLPLAVELAAARVRLLGPAAILDRLERRLPVLVGGATDLPARQQTLRGAIDWSYDLLEVAERRLFERLAVFAGGWTIETAGTVSNPHAELGIDTLDGLISLADKSLIQPMQTDEPEPRFGMLRVIREFAADKLASGPDSTELPRRHAEVTMVLAEAAEPELRASSLRAWQHRLRRERENLRSALQWAVDNGDAETGLRTAGAIWDYWHYWAELREGIGWLEPLLALPAVASAPESVRAKGLRALAGLLYWQGDADRAFALYEQSLAILRTLGDERQIGMVLYDTAWAAIARGDLALATARAEESIEHFVGAGDEDRATIVRSWLVVAPVVTGHGGNPAAALDGIRSAIAANRRLGQAHDEADWFETLPMLLRAVGDFPRAQDAARDSLKLWYELGTLGRLPLGLKTLAAVEIGLNRPERAVRLGAAAERWNDEIGGEVPDIIPQLGDPVEEGRPLLTPAEHARAVAEGRGMSLEQQLAYALEPQ